MRTLTPAIATTAQIRLKEVSRNANDSFNPVHAFSPIQYNTMTVSLIPTSLLADAENIRAVDADDSVSKTNHGKRSKSKC